MIYKKHTIEGFWGFTFWVRNLWFIYITWNTDKDGWARLFGRWYGIHWKHKDHPLVFSERMGFTRYWTIGNYRFKILKPH